MIHKASSFYKMTCFFLSIVSICSVPLCADSATRSHVKKHVRKSVKPEPILPQEPPSWQYLHTLKWGGTVYIDENNIRVNKDTLIVNLLYNLKEKHIVTVGEDIKDYASLTNMKKMNCKTGEQETLNETHYEEFMGRGEKIADTTRYQNDNPMYPMKTEAFWLLENVCRQYIDMNVLVDPNEKPVVVKAKKKLRHKKHVIKSKKRIGAGAMRMVPPLIWRRA
ncbi:MAG: surface-adhesin E family protein [Pseudomonadota bacterium]